MVGLVQVPVFRKWEVATQWLPVAQVVNCLPVVMVSSGREHSGWQASRRRGCRMPTRNAASRHGESPWCGPGTMRVV